MSSLQRALRSEGTSYRDLLEDTRRSLAEQYIAEQNYNLAQIAYLLGFADQSNFTRAFKRWTGMSPSEYRAQGPGEATSPDQPTT
jgi:AraC-like DNA-binding protein